MTRNDKVIPARREEKAIENTRQEFVRDSTTVQCRNLMKTLRLDEITRRKLCGCSHGSMPQLDEKEKAGERYRVLLGATALGLGCCRGQSLRLGSSHQGCTEVLKLPKVAEHL